MARGYSKLDFKKDGNHLAVPSQIEDEILLQYSSFIDENTDFYLYQLKELFEKLKIQKCFIHDVLGCIDYYYQYMQNGEGALDDNNLKQAITVQMMKAYTISASVEKLQDLVDIVDIDKLIVQCNRLIKFRDNFEHILETWKLVMSAASGFSAGKEVLDYKLTLPGLQNVKNSLKLSTNAKSTAALSDSFLINMLGCCQTDAEGSPVNFDLAKPKDGPAISIKDFAEILGNIGELS